MNRARKPAKPGDHGARSIRVAVHLHGSLRSEFPAHEDGQAHEIPCGSSVSALLSQLGATQQAWLVAVNDVVAARDDILRDGDKVDLFPSLEGG